jgi:hypothetical protein
MVSQTKVEIAATASGFVRMLQVPHGFEVQVKRIRGEHKIGRITYWHTIAVLPDRAKAYALYEAYA